MAKFPLHDAKDDSAIARPGDRLLSRREARLHDEIADRVAAVIATGKPPSTHDDYQIEILVMQLYGITRSMCRRIFDVLHEVQRLRVIREMSIAEPSSSSQSTGGNCVRSGRKLAAFLI